MTKPKPKHLLQKVGRKQLPPEQRKKWTLAMIRERCFVTLSECWEWQDTRRRPPSSEHLRCYPTIEHAGERKLVRRHAWEQMSGRPVPEGMFVVPFRCGNPRCQNPFHCKPMTEAQKQRLAAARGSFSTPHRRRACAEGKRKKTTTGMDIDKARRIRATEGPAHLHCHEYGISPGMFNRIRSGKAWREYE